MDGWVFIRLVHALRQVSVAVSSQDIRDAQMCLRRYPNISDKEILKTLFVHRPQDSAIFNTVWEIIVGDSQSPEPEKTHNNISPQELEKHQDRQGAGGQGIGCGSGGVSLTECGDSLDASKLANFIPVKLEELAGSDMDFEETVKRILAELDYYTWINSYDLAYQRGSLSEEAWYAHQSRRSFILEKVRQQVLISQVKADNSWDPLVRQYWLFKPLSHLSEEEKGLVRSSIRKWAKNLALRPGYRWKSYPKGVIDIPDVIRKSVQWDGHLFQLGYRRKVPRAPELVVLCDVSNSMAPFVEFLIYLVTCLRKGFRKIRVFFFIDAVWDVSEYVWDEDLSDVKQEIKSWGHKVSSGFSDYGAVFKELAERHLREVSSRAILMILGDAKNNYRSAQTDYFAQISEGVRRVYWLNPLDLSEWAERDNAMREYQDYCSKVYRCRTAKDLQRIVKDVF
ncbi:protein containing von Willebrand factor type A (vWA) domain [Desulfosporosinus orientis DSM 765]|uniref:Protein containing von Willebrand factor type A (VWA) domain n=1 Tax=Desulfosporosinus orientis (strain ATCC 19365 / DSM 765 / NCIMB 8382 / VKM B-1628 / Singapore I) TaxID=768706 RepID=G7W5Y6_DESOD|nr:VWA domain-containing protein [Desulfosporosinus orientis]AET67362.1 protein containing von Willebrand factor type A (vWA) domain [Desulfosporosinus orientis DSM 765]